MTEDERQTLNQTLDALERLMRMFQAERLIYLACALVSFGLLIYAGVLFFGANGGNGIKAEQLGLFFGAGGLITVAGGRVVLFLNRAFNLVEDIIRGLAGLPNRAG